ncbi:hypothetical protein SAMN02910275_02649 [Butyrivibrio sp. INlla18]|uniref:hypothetical protein n=1 Tax=Butyrivibrio sp. INlla18 TaxID=1520806 RepID=UPI00087EB952|nr:hypothetical protein [Butyrivibrio sp. INlla18]SDA75661.1 hypothetical protein SAMN02910275_02649 [Butyrivibrio sp. INlla18]
MDNQPNNENGVFSGIGHDPQTGQPIMPEPVEVPVIEPQVQPQQYTPEQMEYMNQQQQYQQQQQFQQQQYQQYPQQGMNTAEHPDNLDPTAKKLCWSSLICWIISRIGGWSLGYVFSSLDGEDYIRLAPGALIGLAGLASYILMIYVRIKYPKNRFGKGLMWVYIIDLVLRVLLVVVAILAFVYLVESVCSGIPG